MIFVGSASSCSPFCCGTAGFTAAAAIGRRRTGAGLPARSSNMPRSKSSFRKGSTQSRTRSNTCSPRSHRAGMVDGDGRGGQSGDARRLVFGRGDVCREIGDVRRFDTPRQLMSFLVLSRRRARPAIQSEGRASPWRATGAPVEHSSRRPGHTATPRRVCEALRAPLEGLPKPVRDTARKAQVPPSVRPLSPSHGKKLPIVVAAIAREMAAFL